MENMTITKAIMTYFGKKPGQNTQEFMAELKALTQEDKEYFKPLLEVALDCVITL